MSGENKIIGVDSNEISTQNHEKSGQAEPKSYGKTKEGNATPMQPPKDLIWGWNLKESLPNAVISQFTTFLALWAVELDFDVQGDKEKNPRVRYWKDLLNSGYELSSQITNDIVYDRDSEGNPTKTGPARIQPINQNYNCYIDGSPIKYIPALPNIAQVLTKDAKGGVGVEMISINKPYSTSFTIDISLTISNAYELMEQSSFWRFFVPGQWFLLTTGWQDEGQGYYNPAYHHKGTGVLSEKFKEWPTKTVIPPIIDPATGILHRHFHDINTATTQYLFPAFGFWQSFLVTLMVPSFTMQGSSLQGVLRLATPGADIDQQFMAGQLNHGVTEFINKNGMQVTQIWSKNKSDMDVETGDYNPDKIEKNTIHAIRLGSALKAMIATHNSLVYSPERSSAYQQNTLIFFSEDADVAVSEEMNAPLVNGQGPRGRCNFWIGVRPSNQKATSNTEDGENASVDQKEQKTTGDAPEDFNHVNKVVEHLMKRDEFKVESIYWMEGDQQNIQQAKKKDLETLKKEIKTIADLPINYHTFRKWLEDRKHYDFVRLIDEFCYTFLTEQLGSFFELYRISTNLYYLSWSDQFYKTSVEEPKGKVAQRKNMPALQFNKYILDVFRWEHFTLRYGDYQSLVSEVSLYQGNQTYQTKYEYNTIMNVSKQMANAATAIHGGGDLTNNQLFQVLVNPDMTPDMKKKTRPKNDEGGTKLNDASDGTASTVANPSANGATNMSNKGYVGRNEMYKALLVLGMMPGNGGIYTTIGSFMKGWFDKISITIHGTMGMQEGMIVYFIGTFGWVRGFYVINSISHELSKGGFVTRFDMVWLGADHGVDTPGLAMWSEYDRRTLIVEHVGVNDQIKVALEKSGTGTKPNGQQGSNSTDDGGENTKEAYAPKETP